jgi:hypothetical protein
MGAAEWRRRRVGGEDSGLHGDGGKKGTKKEEGKKEGEKSSGWKKKVEI